MIILDPLPDPFFMDHVFRWICIRYFVGSDPDKYADPFFVDQDPVLFDPDPVFGGYESSSLWIRIGFLLDKDPVFWGDPGYF